MGSHSNQDRDRILQKCFNALDDQGFLIFDVFTDDATADIREKREWNSCQGRGFWTDSPHIVLEEIFHFPEEQTFCRQYVIFTDAGQKLYRTWDHYYSPAQLRTILSSSGFKKIKVKMGLIPKNKFTSNKVMFVISRKI
jgi:hypothetical protein